MFRLAGANMQLKNTTLLVVAVAMLAFLLGFAYGNLFEVQYGFQFKDWQTLASTCVAVIAATLAYIGVRGTQRISVLIKEQDRVAELLPGLRQVNELLIVLRGVLKALRPQHRYQAHLLLDAAFRTQSGESLEDVVRRKLPLADDHLKWEVARLIFALKSQATILKVGHEEVEKYQTEVAHTDTVAPSARQSLLEITERVKESYDRENDTMGEAIQAFDAYAERIKQRISDTETRGRVIRDVIDKFFERGS
jgi:hypothetical protein